MSGIVGIVQLDGNPVDPRLMDSLIDRLALRGPDAQQTWLKDSVALGHTLFKISGQSHRDCQPLTLDGTAWIVADARIDARDDLRAALLAADGDLAPPDLSDAELILRSYRCWGPACVEHFLGDFTFGIWDEARQQFFCARDQMGVKPFYYAHTGSCLVFSNSLDCVRRHPAVSERLDEGAIADFLLFGVKQDPAATSFAEIRRLPPAHRLVYSQNGLRMDRYWSMPVDEPLLYRRPADYIDRFRELLRTVVADRLRSNQAWVFMSGGLDSTTLAATARDLFRERGGDFDLQALTILDPLAPQERTYAQAVADDVRIPIRYRQAADGASHDWEQIPFVTPEPHPIAWSLCDERRFWRECGNCSRVFLFGEGLDNALHFEWRPYVSYLLRRRFYGRLLAGAALTLFSQRYPPFWFRIFKGPANAIEPAFPAWLDSGLQSRLQLRDRWRAYNSTPHSNHPVRPVGYASFQTSLWQAMFEMFDSATTGCAFEMVYPFVDLRMLRFLLSVPALPWCRSKYLVRRAMRGLLPRQVLRRRKVGVPTVPFRRNVVNLCHLPFVPAPGVREYLDPDRISAATSPEFIEGNLRARSLNHWLQNSLSDHHNHGRELLFDAAFR